MHRDHQLDGLGLAGESGAQHPGFEVGAEEALGDQRGGRAVVLATGHHVDGELQGAVDLGADPARAQIHDGRVQPRLSGDGVGQRGPDPELHGAIPLQTLR